MAKKKPQKKKQPATKRPVRKPSRNPKAPKPKAKGIFLADSGGDGTSDPPDESLA